MSGEDLAIHSKLVRGAYAVSDAYQIPKELSSSIC